MPVVGLAALRGQAVRTSTASPETGYITVYNAASAPLAVTLPSLALCNTGANFMVCKDTADTTGNTVTFTCDGSDEFDDAATTMVVAAPGESRTLQAIEIDSVKKWKITGTSINSASAALTVVSVKNRGAIGDATTDDSAAIQSASAALTDNSVLYFPAGQYRFADTTPTGGAAIVLDGLDNVAVVFEPGAELLMDNLSAGDGNGHGVYVTGACSNIVLENVTVRWASVPNRSTGDGFRFLGYPSDSAPPGGWTTTTGPVSNIQLINCTTVNAPQTGAVFMGCSDIRVVNFRAHGTQADGLHFNACRRVNITGHTAVDTGDDGLAFVTYYHASDIWQSADGPFNQAALGEWSNSNSAAANIVATGVAANGIRVAGSYGVTVDNVTVASADEAGIVIDSAIAGGGITWTWHASQDVNISNIVIQTCENGVLVKTNQIDSGDNAAFYTFGVKLSNATIDGCTNWALRTEGDGSESSIVKGLHCNEIRVITGSGGGGNGAVAFSSLRESSVKNLWMTTGNDAQLLFTGQDTALSGAISTLPRHNVVIDNVRNDGGRILFQDLFGLTIGSVRCLNADGDGVIFTRCKQVAIDSMKITLANRGNTSGRGFYLEKVVLLEAGKVIVEHDGNSTGWYSLVIGGGDATDVAAVATHIDKFVYTNTLNQTGNDIAIQGGDYAPVNTVYAFAHYNGGEASPLWRTGP